MITSYFELLSMRTHGTLLNWNKDQRRIMQSNWIECPFIITCMFVVSCGVVSPRVLYCLVPSCTGICSTLKRTTSSLVDGVWEAWTDWTRCTKICGGGTQDRQRACEGPYHGGLDCPGDGTEQKACNTEDCPGLCSLYLIILTFSIIL